MFVWKNRPWIAYESDNGGGSGGNGGGNANPGGDGDQGNGSYSPAGVLPDDVVQGLRNLIDRKDGNTSEALELLYRDNNKLREQRRELLSKLPKDDQRVIAAEDAATLESYRGLGDVQAITASLTELAELKEKLTKTERDNLIRDVAEIAGYKAAVLAEIGGNLEYEISEVQENGGTKRVVKVRDGAKLTPIHEWMKSHKADFIPALQAEVKPPAGNGPRPKSATQGAAAGDGQRPKPLVNIRSVF